MTVNVNPVLTCELYVNVLFGTVLVVCFFLDGLHSERVVHVGLLTECFLGKSQTAMFLGGLMQRASGCTPYEWQIVWLCKGICALALWPTKTAEGAITVR